MVRKIALKIQKVERSLDTEDRKGRKSDKSQTCQQIIIVPSRGSVTDSDNDDPFWWKGGLYLQSAQLIISEKLPCVLLDDSGIFFPPFLCMWKAAAKSPDSYRGLSPAQG